MPIFYPTLFWCIPCQEVCGCYSHWCHELRVQTHGRLQLEQCHKGGPQCLPKIFFSMPNASQFSDNNSLWILWNCLSLIFFQTLFSKACQPDPFEEPETKHPYQIGSEHLGTLHIFQSLKQGHKSQGLTWKDIEMCVDIQWFIGHIPCIFQMGQLGSALKIDTSHNDANKSIPIEVMRHWAKHGHIQW